MESRWQPHIRSESDIWTGVKDAVERRRLQNRLAQRARRAKKQQSRLPKSNLNQAAGKGEHIVEASTDRREPLTAETPDMAWLNDDNLLEFPIDPIEEWNLPLWDEASISSSSSMIVCTRSYPSSESDNTDSHTSSPYSLMFHAMHVIAALWRNADALRLSCSAMSITILDPTLTPPPSLTPTSLQLSIAHLPLIDTLPFPSMRDKILQSQAILDLDDLRRDVLEMGLKCWGRNPWNQKGWELSEEFLEKWWFLIDEGIVEGTNFWRVERGEGALIWKGVKGAGKGKVWEIE